MLKKGSKTVNLSAISMVDVNEEAGLGRIAMHMSARIDLTSKKADITETIEDTALYDNYYDEVENDYADFRKWVKEERDEMLQG